MHFLVLRAWAYDTPRSLISRTLNWAWEWGLGIVKTLPSLVFHNDAL